MRLCKPHLFCLGLCVLTVVCGCGANQAAPGKVAPSACIVTLYLGRQDNPGQFAFAPASRVQVAAVRNLLDADKRIVSLQFVSTAERLRRAGMAGESTAVAPPSFEIVPSSLAAVPDIVGALSASPLGDEIHPYDSSGCASRTAVGVGGNFSRHAVIAAFSHVGIRLHVWQPIRTSPLRPVITGTLIVNAESSREADIAMLASHVNAVGLIGAGTTFHVLVVPRESLVPKWIPSIVPDAERLDLFRGNVYVRDEGMSPGLRARVLSALRHL